MEKPKETCVLIDSDLITYRVGWTTEDEEWPLVRHRVDKIIENIMEGSNAMYAYGFLTGLSNNFRTKVPARAAYKGGRPSAKPKHYKALREYMNEYHGFEIVQDHEADDALAYTHADMTGLKTKEPVVIASIDKDLLQVPGWHYDFVKGEFKYVSVREGAESLAIQMLTGDRTDNISPVKRGVGPVKAQQIIGLDQEYESYPDRIHSWCRANEVPLATLYENASLVYIRRAVPPEGEAWEDFYNEVQLKDYFSCYGAYDET